MFEFEFALALGILPMLKLVLKMYNLKMRLVTDPVEPEEWTVGMFLVCGNGYALLLPFAFDSLGNCSYE